MSNNNLPPKTPSCPAVGSYVKHQTSTVFRIAKRGLDKRTNEITLFDDDGNRYSSTDCTMLPPINDIATDAGLLIESAYATFVEASLAVDAALEALGNACQDGEAKKRLWDGLTDEQRKMIKDLKQVAERIADIDLAKF